MKINSMPIKTFIKLDIAAILFAVLYPLMLTVLSEPYTLNSVITTSVIFWVLGLVVLGFMGKLK